MVSHDRVTPVGGGAGGCVHMYMWIVDAEECGGAVKLQGVYMNVICEFGEPEIRCLGLRISGGLLSAAANQSHSFLNDTAPVRLAWINSTLDAS